MKTIKNILFLLLSVLFSVVLSTIVGNIYSRLFSSDTWVDVRTFIGFPLAFLFFLPLLFTAFGDRYKYWWIGVLAIPAVWFELSFDPRHLYLPAALALLGWLLGLGVRKLLSARTAKT